MLDKNDLQAISELLDSKFEEKLQPINERLDHLDTHVERLDVQMRQTNERLDRMDTRVERLDVQMQQTTERLDRIETDVAAIREDAAITRNAANHLIEWAEETRSQVGRPVPDFPIRKVAKG